MRLDPSKLPPSARNRRSTTKSRWKWRTRATPAILLCASPGGHCAARTGPFAGGRDDHAKTLAEGQRRIFSINELRTDNLGRTWRGPYEHATLGRRSEPDGVLATPADFWPKWHAKSGKLLGIGVNARYANDAQIPTAPRETTYAVYDPEKRTWTPWRSLAVPAEDRFYHGGAGSAQRVDLPNGDILCRFIRKVEARTTTARSFCAASSTERP